MIEQIIGQWGPVVASVLGMVVTILTAIGNVKKIAENSKDKLSELKNQIKEEHCVNSSIQAQNIELKKQVEDLLEQQKKLFVDTVSQKVEAIKASEQAKANEEQLKTIANEFKTIKSQLKQTLRNK